MFRKIFNKIFCDIKQFFIEEYKALIVSFFILILFFYPVNYYIIIGGGISDIDDRITVVDQYSSKGSFNISYVSELKGTVGSYLLSYIIPLWERESVNLYNYDASESVDDIEFRSLLDLDSANGNAIYWAYKLANKECNIISSKIYVISVISGYETSFKVGDLLLEINGNSFSTLTEYQQYIQTLKGLDSVNIKVLRDNKTVEFDTKLYNYDDRIILGIYLQTVNEYKTNPEVKLQFESEESGPSAGLITTLAIYDKLVEKDLTNSLKIAGTGTIESDGSIGQIGGVRYKLIGAAAGGADVFLVPSGDNYEECVKVKKEKNLKIKLVEVSNIEEAIEAIEALK